MQPWAGSGVPSSSASNPKCLRYSCSTAAGTSLPMVSLAQRACTAAPADKSSDGTLTQQRLSNVWALHVFNHAAATISATFSIPQGGCPASRVSSSCFWFTPLLRLAHSAHVARHYPAAQRLGLLLCCLPRPCLASLGWGGIPWDMDVPHCSRGCNHWLAR